jgi:hypothetical protein
VMMRWGSERIAAARGCLSELDYSQPLGTRKRIVSK